MHQVEDVEGLVAAREGDGKVTLMELACETDFVAKNDRFIALALKAKSEKMSTLSLVPPMINTADPDIDLVHEKVREAIDRTEGDAEPAPEARKAKKRKTPTTTGGSIGSLSSGYAANEAEDLGAAC